MRRAAQWFRVLICLYRSFAMKVFVLLCFVAATFAKDANKEAIESFFKRKNLGNDDSTKIADNLKNIPGIEKALETPIIDVDQSKVVTVMQRVILSLEKRVPTECKDSLLVQIITGIIRKRVSNTLRTCDGKVSSELTEELAKISSERTGVSPVVLKRISERTESLYVEIKEKIQDKVLNILQNIGGDCHLERLIIELPALVNYEVVTDRTLGDFISNMAKDIQTRIEPLTTGSGIDCSIDHTDVARKLRQLTSYLETGYKETTKNSLRLAILNGSPDEDIKERIKDLVEDTLETRFDRIVKEVETLMRKFENGEKKECFMELYRETFQEVINDVTAVRVAKRSGVEKQILEVVQRMAKQGRMDKVMKTLFRQLTVRLNDGSPTKQELLSKLKNLANLLTEEASGN